MSAIVDFGIFSKLDTTPMTTAPDTIPAPPSMPPTNTASHPTVGPSAPVGPLGPDALMNACIAASALEVGDLDDIKIVNKIAVGETIWEARAAVPARTDLFIVVLFEGSQADLNDSHTPGDVRAYVMPVGPANPREKRWVCYTMNRTQPFVLMASSMTEAKFIEEVALELNALAGVRDDVLDANEELRDVLTTIREKANETTTPAVTRLASITEMVDAALDPGEEGESEEE